MDVASQNWLVALALGIIAGGLIGWVFGHKMKQGPAKVLTTPLALQSGPTSKVLIVIGLVLVALSFAIGIWQGVAAVVLAYITNTIVGGRVMHDENGGLGKAIKITVIFLLVVCLPFGGYQYYKFNRAPSEQDRLAYIYDCDEYITNVIYKGKDRDTAKAVCGCLWPDLVGRYKSIGMINEKARDNGKVSIGDSDVNAMSITCLKDYQNRD